MNKNRAEDEGSTKNEPPSWNRRRQTLLLATLLAVILLAMLWFLTNREPRHLGRSLSSWLEEINSAKSLSNAEPALLAIRTMDTNALPFLCENVHFRNPSRLNAKIIALAQGFDFLAQRIPPRSSLYSPTCLAFRALGTNAVPIVAQLEQLLLQPEHNASAKLALYAIGISAAPAFERGSESTNLSVRTESALYLAKVHLDTNRFWASGWNTNTHGRLQFTLSTGTTYKDLETLARQLKHAKPAVRRASAEALMLQNDEAKIFLPLLESATDDDDENVRHAVTNAILF